jgi:enamine deaminase RidA (YjgF/YER057c/UK114 family)
MTAIARKHSNHRMSQLVVHGGTAYLAGQIAMENRGQSITKQTEEIMAAIDRLLAEAGTDKMHILSATVWLSDMKDFAEFNTVWDAWVPQGHVPARACVEAKLVAPDFNVEVAVVAAVKQ